MPAARVCTLFAVAYLTVVKVKVVVVAAVGRSSLGTAAEDRAVGLVDAVGSFARQ